MPNEQLYQMIKNLQTTVGNLQHEVDDLKKKNQKYELLLTASTSLDNNERQNALFELAQITEREQQTDDLRRQFK